MAERDEILISTAIELTDEIKLNGEVYVKKSSLSTDKMRIQEKIDLLKEHERTRRGESLFVRGVKRCYLQHESFLTLMLSKQFLLSNSEEQTIRNVIPETKFKPGQTIRIAITGEG